VPRPNLHEVTNAIVTSWSRDTCYATKGFIDRGRPNDHSRGQCGPTALVLQDWLGGELLVAEVFVNDLADGVHYWNRLSDDTEVDLTSDQFLSDETVGEAKVIARPAEMPTRGREQYLLLRDRVITLLGRPEV